MKPKMELETAKHEKNELKAKGKKVAPKKPPTGMNSAIGQGFLLASLAKKGLKA